jgi:GNAT superfamily N-acetyltransferase
MQIDFKPADSSDIETLITMMRELYAHDAIPFNESRTRNVLPLILKNRNIGRVYLVQVDKQTIGYFVLTFGFSLEFGGRDAFVDELFVNESYRGKGVGKATLQFIEDVCRQNEISAVHLEVERANTRAQEVYRAAGYKDHERYLLTKWIDEKT